MKCSKDAFWKCLKWYISKTIIVLTILFLFILLQIYFYSYYYKFQEEKK